MTVNTPHHTNSKSVISQLLLTRFEPNFKGRFLGPYWTDLYCLCDICQGNICHGDICPYQEYLICYWSDFDQTLKVVSWDHLLQMPIVMVTFIQATFVLATFVQIRNVSAVTDLILTKFFGANILSALILLDKLCPKLFWNQKFVGTQHFLDPTFFCTHIFWIPNLSCPILFWFKQDFPPSIFRTKIFLILKSFGPKLFWLKFLNPKFFISAVTNPIWTKL